MRISWLDNLKALGIFLVIFGHMVPDSFLKQYIFSFHVPLFFFVSGYLFDRNKYDFHQFFIRKIRTRLIPYLFFATVSFLFWFFLVCQFSSSAKALAIDPIKPFIGIFYAIGSGGWKVPLNNALWFLPCLFVVEIIFYFVKNKLLLPFFALSGYLATFLPFRLPWSFDIALVGVVFYGVGHFYKDNLIKNTPIPFWLFVIHCASCFLNSPVDMNNLIYGNLLYFYVSSFSGVLFYGALCKLIKRNALLEYLGGNTIILIGFVGIAWFIAIGLYYLLFTIKLEPSGFGFALAASIVQIGLTVPAIYCTNNWCPFLLGRPPK